MDYSCLITVFTPTYNRALLLRCLYESLCIQDFKDFEWLVVNDGSTDDTEQIIKNYQLEGIINIRYIATENGGKHRALNRAVAEAHGELFYLLDSDDYLYDNALQMIASCYDGIRMNQTFGGLWGIRTHPNGQKIGGGSYSILDCSYLEFRYKYKIAGDMAEIFRTSVLREFNFPDIPNEKFCSEGLLWTRISHKYKLRFFYEKICICEYLPDGLTANTVKVRVDSPQYASIGYAEHAHAKVPFIIKVRSAINYWRFVTYTKWSFRKKYNLIGWEFSIFLPISWPFRLYDYVLLKRKGTNINLAKHNSC